MKEKNTGDCKAFAFHANAIMINRVKKEIKDSMTFDKRNSVKLNNKLKKTLTKENKTKYFWNYCKTFFTNKRICKDD